jgi:putative CGCGG family rSAM target protein
MSDVAAEDIEREAEPITDRVHDNSWSANLEHEQHTDRERVLVDAVAAIEHTTPGNHVNPVTHGDHGHPSTYLYHGLAAEFGDAIDSEFVDRCGCGGYVTRVHVAE